FFLCFLAKPCHNQPGSRRSGCQRPHLVLPISAGGRGLRKPVLMPTAIHGFGNWSEPQDGPFSCQEDPLSAPTPVFEVCSSMLYGHYGGPGRAAEEGWVGLYRSVTPGGWGFYLALAATISASQLLISNLPPSKTA